jgi:TRAP-type C4-dicarboxylate transport system permease small subunit
MQTDLLGLFALIILGASLVYMLNTSMECRAIIKKMKTRLKRAINKKA